jgi:hypothetical protein
VFPVRYELNFYILLIRRSLLNRLNTMHLQKVVCHVKAGGTYSNHYTLKN